MAPSRTEYEVRLLPEVVACRVDDDGVTVLASPDADPGALEASVRQRVADLGEPLTVVRVLGGRPPEPPTLPPGDTRPRRRWLVLALVAVLVAVAVVTAMLVSAANRHDGAPAQHAPKTKKAAQISTTTLAPVTTTTFPTGWSLPVGG